MRQVTLVLVYNMEDDEKPLADEREDWIQNRVALYDILSNAEEGEPDHQLYLFEGDISAPFKVQATVERRPIAPQPRAEEESTKALTSIIKLLRRQAR
jgi:hypothetical protein